jgi:hypothetical protein
MSPAPVGRVPPTPASRRKYRDDDEEEEEEEDEFDRGDFGVDDVALEVDGEGAGGRHG